MNESLKVQAHHLERSAYLYIRQSSMRQVLENVESTKRQYAGCVVAPSRSAGERNRLSSSTTTRVSDVSSLAERLSAAGH